MEKHHVTRCISKVWTGPMDHWTFGLLLDLLRTGFLDYQHLGRGVSSFFICREEETITLLQTLGDENCTFATFSAHDPYNFIIMNFISYIVFILERDGPTHQLLFIFHKGY